MPPRRRPARLAALVLAVAVGTVACSPGYSAEPYTSVAVGASFPALLGEGIVGDVATVQLPGRAYELEVSRPQATVDPASADEATASRDAPSGGAFVAVAWRPRPPAGDAVALGYRGPAVSPQLSLLAGDATYAIGPLDAEGVPAVWVAVPAGVPIGVAVEFDGVVQTIVDMTDPAAAFAGGPASLYAAPPDLHAPDCPGPAPGPETEPARVVAGGCSVQVSDPIAYHQDLGWAEGGRSWIVARLSVDPVVVRWDEPGQGTGVDYVVAPQDVAVTLDGAGPAAVLPWEPGDPAGIQDDGRWVGDAVFAVPTEAPSSELAFVRPYTGVPRDPSHAAAQGSPAQLAGTYAARLTIAGG